MIKNDTCAGGVRKQNAPFFKMCPEMHTCPQMAWIGPNRMGKLVFNALKWVITQVAINKTLTKLFVLDCSRFFLQVVSAIAFFFLRCWFEYGVPTKKIKKDIQFQAEHFGKVTWKLKILSQFRF